MANLKKIEKKLKSRATEKEVPAYDDPKSQLRRLVQEHAAVTKAAVATKLRSTDKKVRLEVDGKVKTVVRPCRLPKEVQDAEAEHYKLLKKRANVLARWMESALKKLPIWTEFLVKVKGCGAVTAGYLIANIDFRMCEKPSVLRRFCGLGVHDGKADRRTKGQKLWYVSDIKRSLYLMFVSLRKNFAKRAHESKYLARWQESKHGLLTTVGQLGTKERSNGWCDTKSRRKATDLFIEDLYIVGRALEGLPVWPSWYAKAMGYQHGGKVAVLSPKMLTLDEALDLVGIRQFQAQTDEELELLETEREALEDEVEDEDGDGQPDSAPANTHPIAAE